MDSRKIITIAVALVLLLTGCGVTPWGRAVFNSWGYAVQKANDATSYDTQKQVEDTCRAMIASYTADRLTYLQYYESDDDEKLSWAEQAKMRANRTAASYNEYVLKNSFVWNGNIPSDIKLTLEYL